jgi:hypothetical protein
MILITQDIFCAGPQMQRRQLTEGEITLAKSVFGDAIDYTRVTLHGKRILPPGIQHRHQAVAVGNRISFPRNAYSDDFSKETSPAKQSVFIHELVHVWQHQNNVLSTPREAVRETLKHKFNYSNSYHYTLMPKHDLTSYGFEQQAAIIQDYFLLTRHNTQDSYKNRRRAGANPATLKKNYEAVLEKFLQNPIYAKRQKPRHKHRRPKP